MDANTFDTVVKVVGVGGTRRRVLAGLLAAALSGWHGQPVAADETPKPNGKKCNRNGQCRSGHCCGASRGQQGFCRACCEDGDCSECQTCASNTCQAVDNGTPCGATGAGLRCCSGNCPPPCLPNGTCCFDTTTCRACCGGAGGSVTQCAETDGILCSSRDPGQPCKGDSGCVDNTICVCGTCVLP